MHNDKYRALAARTGLPDSENMYMIWKALCSEEESEIALMLPGNADDMSVRSGKSSDSVTYILLSLFKKGVAFKSISDGITHFRPPKNIIQFHDASILWDDADENFFQLWNRVMNLDFPEQLKKLSDTVTIPSYMKIIPARGSLDGQNSVLPHERCEHIVRESSRLAVVNCPCRLSQQNCDSPLEVCIQVNRGAEYALDSGHGREISLDEALNILEKSEKDGLVHMVENRDYTNSICNCCTCCCEIFNLMNNSGKKWVLSPSRYVPEVNHQCNGCGACSEVCPVNAIATGTKAIVNTAKCIGCGLCVTRCSEKAISLTHVKPAGHDPAQLTHT